MMTDHKMKSLALFPQKFILVEIHGAVALLRLNRPEALNALCSPLISELNDVLDKLEQDKTIHAVVLTGSEKAFAAGADIKELKDQTYLSISSTDIFEPWERLENFKKPIIAAVSGYALGGGCELALMCDFIIASRTAKFGQPEVSIGTIPAAGGTQRLTRLIGKSKAMDMCLTGRMMDAEEAERAGIVSRITTPDTLVLEALKIAAKITSFSGPVTDLIKKAVNAAYESTLTQGLRYERNLSHASFALEDRKEGMQAFSEKRPAVFKHR